MLVTSQLSLSFLLFSEIRNRAIIAFPLLLPAAGVQISQRERGSEGGFRKIRLLNAIDFEEESNVVKNSLLCIRLLDPSH